MSKDVNLNINFKDIPSQLGHTGHALARYIPLMFLVIIASIYSFLLIEIGTISNTGPDESAVANQTASISPNIDKKAIEQMKALQDNSVNVQTLFEQARSNPFNE